MTALLVIIIVLVVAGLAAWAVNVSPIANPYKQLIQVVIAVAAALYLAIRFL